MKSNITENLATEALEEFQGQIITHAWRGHGSSIFMEFGKLVHDIKRRQPVGEQTISVEWSWRIENTESILIGSWCDEEHINRAPEILIGKRVESIEFFGVLKEIRINFGGNIFFSSFASTEGNPEWAIKLKNGFWLSFERGGFIFEQ